MHKRPEDMSDKELNQALANSQEHVLIAIANLIRKASETLLACADSPEEIRVQSKILARVATDLVRAVQSQEDSGGPIN